MLRSSSYLVVAATVAQAVCGIAEAQGGTALSFRYTIAASDSGRGGTDTVEIHVVSSGARTRTEFVRTGDGQRRTMGYTVVDSDSDAHTTVLAGDAMALTISARFVELARPKLARDVAWTTTELTELGAGESMLGQSTRRYRLSRTGTASAGNGDSSCVRAVAMVSEIWLVPTLSDLMGPFSAGLAATTDPSDDWVRELLVDSSQLPRAMVARIASTWRETTRTDAVTFVRTMQVSEATRVPEDLAAFRLPAGTRSVDIRQAVAALPQEALDDAMNARAGGTEGCR